MFSLLLRAHVEPLFCVLFVSCFCGKKTAQNGQPSLPILNYPRPTCGLLHSHLLQLVLISDCPQYGCSHVNTASQQICVLFFFSCKHHTIYNIFFLHLKQNSGGESLWDALLCTVQWFISFSVPGCGDATLYTVYRSLQDFHTVQCWSITVLCTPHLCTLFIDAHLGPGASLDCSPLYSDSSLYIFHHCAVALHTVMIHCTVMDS